MTTILQFVWFMDMISDNAIPNQDDYEKMTLDELNSMAYTYNFGLTNKGTIMIHTHKANRGKGQGLDNTT